MSTGLSAPVAQPNSLSSFLNDLNELAGLKQQETQLATQIASGNPRDVLRTDTITFPNGMKRPATDAELMAAARTLSDMPTAKMQGMSAAGDILGNVPFVRDVVNAPTSMAAYIAARRITNGPDDWLVKRTNPGMSKGAAFATIEAARRQMESTEGGVKQFYANLGLPEPAANFVSGVHQQGVGNLEFLPVVLSSAVVTNGLAVGARKAGQNAVADLLEMEAKDAFQKGAGKLIEQQAARFGANAVNAAINPMSAPKEALQRITPRGVEQTATGEFVPVGGESLQQAIPKAVVSQAIEMQSENLGELMGPALGAALRRSGLSAKAVAAVPEFVKRWASSPGIKTIQSLASGMKSNIPGFHGVPQEYFEERIGEVWKFASGVEKDAGITGKVLQGDIGGATEQSLQELAAFGIMGGVNRGLGREQSAPVNPVSVSNWIGVNPNGAAAVRRLPNNPSRQQWASAVKAAPELADLDVRSAQDRAAFMQSFRQADDMAEQRRMDDVFAQHAPASRDLIRQQLAEKSQTTPTLIGQPPVAGGKNMGIRKGVATPRQIISEQEVVPPAWPEQGQQPQQQEQSNAAQQVQEQGRPEGQVAEPPQQQPQQPVAEQQPAAKPPAETSAEPPIEMPSDLADAFEQAWSTRDAFAMHGVLNKKAARQEFERRTGVKVELNPAQRSASIANGFAVADANTTQKEPQQKPDLSDLEPHEQDDVRNRLREGVPLDKARHDVKHMRASSVPWVFEILPKLESLGMPREMAIEFAMKAQAGVQKWGTDWKQKRDALEAEYVARIPQGMPPSFEEATRTAAQKSLWNLEASGVSDDLLNEFRSRASQIEATSEQDAKDKVAALASEYAPKAVVGELDDTNAPLKQEEEIDVPLWEMDDEQLRVAHDKARKGDMALYEAVFGKEGAKKYKALLRQENSFDREVSDKAVKERHDMEDALTERQQDMLFNSDIPDPQVISRFREAVSQGASTPRELGRQLGIEMIRLSGDVGKDPADMTLDKQLSFASINAAKRYAAASGWTTQEHLDEINRGAVEYVTSHVQIDDVDMILRPWGLSAETKAKPRQEPRPDRPKIGQAGVTKAVEEQQQAKEPWQMTREEWSALAVQRIDRDEDVPTVNKQWGLYTTPADRTSPHLDIGNKLTYWLRNPAAKVLDVTGFNDDKTAMRYGATNADAGVAAARCLLGESRFQDLRQMGRGQLIAQAQSMFPDVDFSSAHDAQEAMGTLGASLARSKGYDAILDNGRPKVSMWSESENKIISTNKDPFAEYVALTDNAMFPSLSHSDEVAKALSAGKPVPAEVLADYPDLAEKYGVKNVKKKGVTKAGEDAQQGTNKGVKREPSASPVTPRSPPKKVGLRGQTATPEGEASNADQSPRQKSGRVAAVGGDTQIDVPSGEPIAAKYGVIEAADIVPSHSYLSGGLSDNRKKGTYPEGLQPREYKIGSPADVKVRKFAQQKKVAYFISTHPDATNGPPVVSQDGIVINGNGRAMALQLASLSDYGWYKDALVRDAATYGISSEQVSSMKAPILVRVVAMDATSDEAKKFARQGNVATTYEDTPIRKAAAMSHLVNVADVVQLSNQITPDITIAGVLGKTSAGKSIREAMYQSMPESMRSQYFNDDRTFTNDGEEFATNLLLAKAFDADLIERLSSDRKALLQSLADSIVPILDLGKSDKGKRIFDALQKALDIVSRRPSLKTATDVGKMFAQRGLLEAGGLEDIDRSPMVKDLTAFFVQFASSRKKVRTTLLGIAADTRFQGGLFASEDSSPEEIVSDAVSKQSRTSKGDGPQVLSRKLDRGGRLMKEDDASDKPQAGTELQRLGNPAEPPKEAPPRPVDVLESVRELFGGAIEPGRMWSKQAAGEFEIRTEAIHLAKGHEANLVVAGHELAHRIDKQHDVVRDSMPPQLKRALSELDYAPEVHAAQILNGADPLLSIREGFAEYVRHRLQGTTQPVARQVLVNDGTITQKYADALGVVDAWFENEWLPAHPDVAKRLVTITQAADKYIAAGPQHRILAGTSGVDGIRPTLVSVKEYPDVGLRAIDDAIAGFRANWVNEWEYLERYEKEVVKRGGALPDDNLSALQFARSLDNAASLAKSFVDDGVRTWDGQTVLHDGLAAAFRRHDFKTAAEIDEWEAYHIARRVMAIHETRPEYRSSADIRDMEAMVAKIESDPSKADRYEAMTEDYTAFNNAVLDWAVGMGLVEADAAQRMKDSHGGVYMYMAREQRNRGKPSSFTPNVGMGIIPLHNPFKRLGRGSQMPFYRPIEAAVLKTYETISNAYQKQVVVQMWKAQRKAKGMGAWIEEVPAGNKANKVRLDDLLAQLVEAGVVKKEDADLIHAVGVVKKGTGNKKAFRTIKQQLGIDADAFDDFQEYQSAVDEAAEQAGIANANDMLTTWMPNYAMSRKEGVFSFRDDTGQMRTVRVHPEIFNSLVMSRAYGAQNAFGKLINVMGGIISRGAVRYNPAFPLANLVRDYWTQVAQANEQSLPETLVQPLNGVLQMTLDALKQHGIVAGERDIMTELFVEKGSAEWYAMNASPVGLHELRRKILTDAGVSQPLVVKDAVRGGLKSLTDVLTLGEAAVRRGEFVASLNNQGYYSVNNQWHKRADDGTLQPLPEGAQPPEPAIAKAALAARDVTVDFQTKGRLSKRIPMFFGPFFNAKVQSLDRMYRQIKTALAHPDKAVRDKAMKRLVAFAAMQSALAALIWYFTHDEDWYNADREPWIKYRYFQPVAGLRIPKGYEWSVFANVTEATLNIMFKKDPENTKKTVERFLTQRSELGELAYATAESVSPVSLPPKVPIVEDMPLVSTIYQLATNTDWRGKPIVTKDVADLETSEQYRDTTPAAYKAAGKAFGVSPLQIEYGAEALSGGVTRRAFRTYDKLAEGNVTGAIVEGTAGGFTLPRDSSRATQDYFDALDKADKRVKTAERRKQADPEAKDALDILNAYGDVLKAIRKASREATTEDQKTALWHMEIGTARDAIGRKALDRYKSAMSPDAKLPPEVQKSRDQELLRQMRKIAANKPVSVTPLERTNGLTLAEKQAEWARDKKVAARILRDAGWSWSKLAPVWTSGTDRTDSDGTKRSRIRVAVDLGSP